MLRQVNRTDRFTDEISLISVLQPSRSHRPDKKAKHVERVPASAPVMTSTPKPPPISQDLNSTPKPKVQKDRLRSLDCATFQKLLRKCHRESGQIRLHSYEKDGLAVKVEVLYKKYQIPFGHIYRV